MKRVLVTGATGFVGRALIPHLVARGYSIRAASRTKLPNTEKIENIYIPDLAHRLDWAPLLSGVDAIIHTAAIAHTNAADDVTYDAINHRAVVALAQAAAGKVERLVFLSSIRAQCGSSAPSPVTEIDDPRPTDAYGRAKLLAEEALARMNAAAVILRPVLVVAPSSKGNLATMLRFAKLPLPLPFGALEAKRSVVARTDLCSAITHVLKGSGHIGETYIVAHPEPISIAAMFAALREGLGSRPFLLRVPAPLIRKAMIMSRLGNAVDKLFGDLVASPIKLMRTGWKPSAAPRAALVEMGEFG